MRIFSVILLTCCLSLFISCNNDDDDSTPSFMMEYADLLSNESGVLSTAITDGGEMLNILNPQSGLKADSTYRYIIIYLQEQNGIRISSYGHVISDSPRTLNKPVKTDSVTMQSIWRARHYINLTLKIMRKDKGHAFAFLHQGITTAADGHKTLNILLYHDSKDDLPAFSNTGYFSCSLANFTDSLVTGRDSVKFIINEYKKGPTHYYLPF